jgi:hypothetical protein
MTPNPNPPLDHATYVALLDEAEGVHPLPHALYVALVRGDGEAPDFAGRTMTLADWYVRLEGRKPDFVVNETYTPVTFDARGKIDWTATIPGVNHQGALGEEREQAWLPTKTQREKMRAAVFSGDLSHGPSLACGSGQH